MNDQVWYSGPPPSIGWWQASAAGVRGITRWWDGKRWSAPATRLTCRTKLPRIAETPAATQRGICWTAP